MWHRLERRVDQRVLALALALGGADGEAGCGLNSFDLVTREMDLTSELPLALLGEKILAEFNVANLGLHPNMLVPLRISGTPTKPRLAIPREFAQKLLEDTAKDAAKKGLGDLLERALKKDGLALFGATVVHANSESGAPTLGFRVDSLELFKLKFITAAAR